MFAILTGIFSGNSIWVHPHLTLIKYADKLLTPMSGPHICSRLICSGLKVAQTISLVSP
jgi:hypothetical protein